MKFKIISIIAITINLVSLFYKLLKGHRVALETMLPLIIIGSVITISVAIKEMNALAWVAIITGILSLILFLSEQFILTQLFKNIN